MRRLLCALLASLLLLTGCAERGVPDPIEPSVSPDTPPAAPLEPVIPELTAEELAAQYLASLLDGMTLEEKVGQLFFVRCPETGAAEDVAAYHLGGLLLFGRDYKDAAGEWLSADELTAKLEDYQSAAAIPLFIGSDEEGGTVTRASRNPNLFKERSKSPQQLYAANTDARDPLDTIAADVEEKSARLLEWGINVNFAPVADVSTDPADFIYDRALGQDASATAEYVARVAEVMRGAGMASVLKHFPGYGNNVDTHTGIAIDTRSYETFTASDFLPFAAGIAAGAPFVLVSHNVVECMDGSLPASLSPKVHEILRDTLGFTGIAITDDLAMDAVAAYAGGEAAVLAVLAGNDMLVTSDYQNDIPAVLTAVADGRISEEQIDESVLRVLHAKYDLGLLADCGNERGAACV